MCKSGAVNLMVFKFVSTWRIKRACVVEPSDHILSISCRYMELLFDCVVNFTVISQFEENETFILLVPV